MKIMVCVVLLIDCTTIALSQPCTPPENRTWIRVSNAGAEQETLWFGFDPMATYGLDMQLCEVEIPHPPPAPLDVSFVNIPGREGWDTPLGLGMGFWQDYRTFRPLERDTFQIKIWWPGTPGFPIHLAWSPSDQFFLLRDTVLLFDGTGGLPIIMDHDSLLTLANSTNNSLLITVGPQNAVNVQHTGGLGPQQGNLWQNFPNPFNSTTTIDYYLAATSLVTLRVYDLLGRELATLVEGEETQGTKRVRFNADWLASGVYLYRLNVGEAVSSRMMLLLK